MAKEMLFINSLIKMSFLGLQIEISFLFILILNNKNKTLEALIANFYEFLNVNEKNLRVFLCSW